MAIYWSRGEPSYNMRFYYNGGNYSYQDFSSFDEGIERTNTDKENLIKLLKKFDIILTKGVIFNMVDDRDNQGIYEWSIDNYVDGEYITNGNLTAEYYSDDSIKRISNNIIKYKKVEDVSIKSKKEAYRELEQGKFNLYKPKDIKVIKVEDISLSYILDTKGFYQPVYNFKLKIDEEYNNIFIPAL